MSEITETGAMPPSIERVLRLFRALPREEKMQTLVHYSRKLEPLPDRIRDLDRAPFIVPECMTHVELFPEYRDGNLHFFAKVNSRQSPTVAAFLAIVFSAINDHPPAATLAIPNDFVLQVMSNIGLSTRETGLNAIIARLKRHAREAQAAA